VGTVYDAEREKAERDELDGLVDELLAIAAEEASLEARRISVLARAFAIAEAKKSRVGSKDSALRDLPLRSIASELAVATRVNDRTMQQQIDEAVQVTEYFPRAVRALREGRISRGHLDAVLDAGARLSDPVVRAAFEQVVLERAVHESPARLRVYARRAAEQAEPVTTQERFDIANARRTVSVVDLGDGTAELRALLATAVAFGIKDRLDQQAKAVQRASQKARARSEAEPDAEGEDGVHDHRTRDQIRADLLADMLLTATPTIDTTTGEVLGGGLGAIRGSVQITVPVTTLTGVTEGGAELDGHSPVDAGTARILAGGAPGWDRVMTDPVTGTVLEVDRYHPAADQQRFLDARDIHCRWPGCRTPVRHCQLDHNAERQHGGKTSRHNLAHLCVRHHTLKTETEWTVVQHTDGTLHFTSPAGRTYLDKPPPRVVFVPDDAPAPF
jgi:hypothetical protein